MIKKIILPLVAGILLLSCAVNKRPSKAGNDQKAIAVKDDPAGKDSVKKIKPYKDVITAKAVSQDGLFKVHRVDSRYYFEIPDSLFDRDLLLVNRISKGNFNNQFSSFAGDDLGDELIQLAKGPNDKVFIRQMSYAMRSDDADGQMQRAIDNANMQPFAAAFDIKAISPDSAGVVVDVTDLFNSDNEFFFFTAYLKKTNGYALSGFVPDKSYIGGIRSFPQNVEIKTVKTYVKGGNASLGVVTPGNVTFELNNSIVLLPKNVMKPRYYDPRVGYFVWGYWNFESSRPLSIELMATRWRLEPKPEDIEKYKKGILVEPQKPIVFYIDPATPKKWVPYLVQGVNSWQKAFEKAGFKNAIYALEAPVNDTGWSIEDARHNVIVYKASAKQNAIGPHIRDPRSGEILESHVHWFHNVQQLLHDWYFVQASPNDPQARKMLFDDTLMGKLIRYVCAHEIGHTLGLQHNLGASATIPVDSLRSKNYVRQNGFCPSIMDYARFNYVAQPSDGMDQEDLFPRIGVYDEWAIEWGYKWLPDLGTKEEEKAFINKWIIERVEQDKRLVFGPQGSSDDPRRQSEDLGDNSVKAGRYGVANLKHVMHNLQAWTYQPGEDYESTRKMNNQVFLQYVRYLAHAMTNIGGQIKSEKTVEQKEPGLIYPSREIQKSAIRFLHDELFTRPSWLMDKEIYLLTASEKTSGLQSRWMLLQTLNKEVIKELVSGTKLLALKEAQDVQPQSAYTVEEYLNDLEKGLWKELGTNLPIEMYRRDVQKMYLDRLLALTDLKNIADGGMFVIMNSDVFLLVKRHVKILSQRINTAIPSCRDAATRYHLVELQERIHNALHNKNGNKTPASTTDKKDALHLFNLAAPELFPAINIYERRPVSCWENAGGFNMDLHKDENY
jgi:hypothetical protein